MARRVRSLGRAAVVLFAAVVSSGCWRRNHEVANAWQWRDELPPGATIHLRNTSGSIRVRPSNSDVATVVGSKRWRFGRERDVEFVAKRVGNEMYVCAVWGSRGRCDENGYRSRSRGMFHFLGFHWGTDAAADLRLEIPPGVKVDAQTTNGTIDISGAHAGGAARTVNGTVVVRQSSGAFDVSSVNGSLRLALDSVSATDTLNLETTNGSVRAELPKTFNGAVSLSTVNGGLHTEMPVTATGSLSRRNLDGRIGSGQQLIRVRTVNGGITLAHRSS